jgi:hypothetical protein
LALLNRQEESKIFKSRYGEVPKSSAACDHLEIFRLLEWRLPAGRQGTFGCVPHTSSPEAGVLSGTLKAASGHGFLARVILDAKKSERLLPSEARPRWGRASVHAKHPGRKGLLNKAEAAMHVPPSDKINPLSSL